MKIAIRLALGLVACSATTANGVRRYFGAFLVDTVTSQCSGYPSVGMMFDLRFRPAGIGDNGADTTFNLFDRIQSISHKVTNSALSSVAKNYTGTWIGGNSGTSSGTIKLTSNLPTLTTKTDFISMAGTITNFDGLTGCTVTFRASVVRQLN